MEYLQDIRLGIFEGLLGVESVDKVLNLYEYGVGGSEVVVYQWVSLIVLVHEHC